jgi:hypothetical protein
MHCSVGSRSRLPSWKRSTAPLVWWGFQAGNRSEAGDLGSSAPDYPLVMQLLKAHRPNMAVREIIRRRAWVHGNERSLMHLGSLKGQTEEDRKRSHDMEQLKPVVLIVEDEFLLRMDSAAAM